MGCLFHYSCLKPSSSTTLLRTINSSSTLVPCHFSLHCAVLCVGCVCVCAKIGNDSRGGGMYLFGGLRCEVVMLH
ncbi:hypothetical protein L873DRAFT_919761 [Choiromyces venosus 120613-1]|uniref:Uncharacterized protein n=1 Tax=Choiromyces venosus 120613-1 TaxID=1336337 RepID=A0A3N4JM68_9PEZI|nr:hypothetical protein L873DRAFT_919761 [Choiromyces venosus 120613-1]